MFIINKFSKGHNLSELMDMSFLVNVVKNLKQKAIYEYFDPIYKVIKNLMSDSSINNKLTENNILHESSKSYIFSVNMHMITLDIVFSEFNKAKEKIVKIKKYLDSVTATIHIPMFFFYESLIYLALYDKVSRLEKLNTLKIVYPNLKKLKNRAKFGSMNMLHKYYLVEAELARVRRQK